MEVWENNTSAIVNFWVASAGGPTLASALGFASSTLSAKIDAADI